MYSRMPKDDIVSTSFQIRKPTSAVTKSQDFNLEFLLIFIYASYLPGQNLFSFLLSLFITEMGFRIPY